MTKKNWLIWQLKMMAMNRIFLLEQFYNEACKKAQTKKQLKFLQKLYFNSQEKTNQAEKRIIKIIKNEHN